MCMLIVLITWSPITRFEHVCQQLIIYRELRKINVISNFDDHYNCTSTTAPNTVSTTTPELLLRINYSSSTPHLILNYSSPTRRILLNYSSTTPQLLLVYSSTTPQLPLIYSYLYSHLTWHYTSTQTWLNFYTFYFSMFRSIIPGYFISGYFDRLHYLFSLHNIRYLRLRSGCGEPYGIC